MNATARTETIKRLNDQLRTTFTNGRVVMTNGIQALGEETVGQVLAAVRAFTTFTEDNDPHGEHDFGSLEVGGQTVFWKIDCYSTDMTAGSEHPEDPAQTTRVLTIMLADEY
jgi:hypothetical protein